MKIDKTITYNINVNDLIKALKEYKYVKIELYNNGNFAIMSETASGHPDKAIHIENYNLCDFVDCDSDVDKYVGWLESWCGGSLDVYKYDKPQCKICKIYVNWLR